MARLECSGHATFRLAPTALDAVGVDDVTLAKLAVVRALIE